MAQRSGLNSRVCQWIGQGDALRHFATYSGSTQSQQHIKPPTADSPLHLNRFFGTLYRRFDERFVYGAPDLKSVTRRLEWSPESPALAMENARSPGYGIRLASG